MRHSFRFFATTSLVSTCRWSSTTTGVGAAQKRTRGERIETVLPSAARMVPKADADFSTRDLNDKLSELSKLTPEQLETLVDKLGQQESTASKAMADDGVHQMDVSLATKYQGGQKVFWKTVSTYKVPDLSADSAPWWGVELDGRKVKAFETTQPLIVPTEDFALAIAHEYAQQSGVLNKLLMPLTDLASGAQHVNPQMMIPRIDYLMAFFRNDNLYYRAEAIADEQDELIEPIRAWWARYLGLPLEGPNSIPRYVGIAHTHFSPQTVDNVRDGLIRMQLNPYQLVALCVVAQHTASLMLPLAVFHGVCDIETALTINRAEESHNTAEHGSIQGFHDIREADVVLKIAASLVAWRMTADTSMSACARMIGPRTEA